MDAERYRWREKGGKGSVVSSWPLPRPLIRAAQACRDSRIVILEEAAEEMCMVGVCFIETGHRISFICVFVDVLRWVLGSECVCVCK